MGKQKNTEQFIEDARKVHGDKYDYTKTDYKKALEKVVITCPIHGDFTQTPNSHLYGRGCPICGKLVAGEKIRKQTKGVEHQPHRTKEEMIEAIKEKCKNRYGISKMDYHRSDEKVCLICPEHGEFWLTPNNILHGNQGCPKCAAENRIKAKTKTLETFIKEANEMHFGFYNYDKVVYVNARKKVTITCPIHGDFEQSPDNHLKGCGCPYCQSSFLENTIRHILDNNGINYIQQYSPKWLTSITFHRQSLDFYLPEQKIAIECQGIQHMKPRGAFGSKSVTPEEFYNNVCKLDDRKNKLCKENNVKLIYYAETNEPYRYPLCRCQDELLKAINGS